MTPLGRWKGGGGRKDRGGCRDRRINFPFVTREVIWGGSSPIWGYKMREYSMPSPLTVILGGGERQV